MEADGGLVISSGQEVGSGDLNLMGHKEVVEG